MNDTAGMATPGPRWGIVGGTFDPVHFGHLVIAEQAADELSLAGVYFMPVAQPVHKPAGALASAADRRAMLELAIADNPRFTLLDIDLERGGSSYSVETMELLVARRPADRFGFILSAENARQVHTWRRPERLLELCQVAIVNRLGYPTPDRTELAQLFGALAEQFLFVESVELGHSASDIRARVARGRSIRYLVPAPVEDYIAQHRLYREAYDRPTDDRPPDDRPTDY